MSILSQLKYQRQCMIKYVQKHFVTETAIRYNVSRKTVYKWLSQYDSTVMSLEDHIHRPISFPRSHTEKELGIIYHRIQIATPRHNGKVERQHRTDEARIYRYMKMYSLEDGRKQLVVYQRKSNNYIKTCLGMKTPNQVIKMYQDMMY